MIVDDLLASPTWPGQGAIGKKLSVEHFKHGEFLPGPAEVVGVVAHIQHHSLTRQVRGQIYITYPQSARTHLSYVVRTKSDPLGLAGRPARAG